MQRLSPRGYQQITTLTAAVGLTLPVGAEQASGSACSLSGSLLTIGGTVTGAFGVGQTVQGTGIPANTRITAPASSSPNPTTWLLSASCTTEVSEAVTAYATVQVDCALIRATGQTVMWRDDGTTPTASIGFPLLVTDPPFYYTGDLAALQFIQASATAGLDVSYYKMAG